MSSNLITLRIILLAVTVAVATNCLGAAHKGGAMKILLMAEAPALGWIESGSGQ